MSSTPFNIVIPCRYASSRFPGKPLHPLNGKAMVLHVIDRARESDAANIVVATDDERIAELCRSVDADVEMTQVEHVSGTDRIAEVATRRGWVDDAIIVGLQGDEPATPAALLNSLATNLANATNADMASLCVPVENAAAYANRNRVKVVRDKNNMALYFSRASIPARRDGGSDADFPDSFIHVGLYAYRCQYLKRFAGMAPAYIEEQEQLEQLRVLYDGGRIHVATIDEAAMGVDHPDDVAAIEAILAERFSSSGNSSGDTGDNQNAALQATDADKPSDNKSESVSASIDSTSGEQPISREWQLEKTETVYRGFYQMDKLYFRHALFNGGTSALVDREQFIRGDVVGVIAHDPVLDKLAFVEQFRIGARNRPDHPWLIEIIAGMVEPNEQPEEVAVREAYEEAGIHLTDVKLAFKYFASPGASTEVVNIFYAHADLSDAGGVYGLDAEDEDILMHVVDRKEAFNMVKTGRICNALSLVALQWLELNSD